MGLRRISLVTLVIMTAAGLGGCPQPGDTNPPPPTVTLSAAQSAAVDSAAAQLTAFASLLGTFSELASSQLSLDSLPTLELIGDCPRISIATDGVKAFFIFNFAEGCISSQTGGRTVSGKLNIDITDITGTAGETAITSLDLAIDGQAISGVLDFTLTRDGDTITLAGEITETVEISGVGSVTGSLTVKIASSGVITITTANLTFNDGSTSQSVTLTDVVIDPVGNGNFVPQSGTASFSLSEGDATTTLVVTFNANTPTDGSVDVAVGTTGSASHTIPVP
ncbi:MAG: hypothetical protein IID33_03045 [Planctomycetes bacterium]|nr:hypothetical protein [Planctomycetota bacterium]